jgi:hypothetical protein
MHGLHERRFQTTPNEHLFLFYFFQLEISKWKIFFEIFYKKILVLFL